MSEFLRKRSIVRRNLSDFRTKYVHDGIIKDRDTLYFSEHLADRIVERKLEKDIDFICAVAIYFYKNVFLKTTYIDRRYCMQLKNLKVGIDVSVGPHSDFRRMTVTTAFTSDIDYFCDEKINLKV